MVADGDAPVLEYVKHRTTRPRLADGRLDIGAYELGSVVGVPETDAAVARHRLRVRPNPFFQQTWIARLGAEAPPGALLEITDVTGRRVAELPAGAGGVWTWSPGPDLPRGIYLASTADGTEKLVYLGR